MDATTINNILFLITHQFKANDLSDKSEAILTLYTVLAFLAGYAYFFIHTYTEMTLKKKKQKVPL